MRGVWRRRTVGLLAGAALLAAGCRTPGGGRPGGDQGPPVRLNEIQVLASHNSYHVEPEPVLMDALTAFLGDEALGFGYTHRPLAEQLDAGVRQIELDVFVDDPEGGRYASPALGPALGLAPVDPALAEPGLKVLHVQEVDFRSTCATFTACLTDVREWSDANPATCRSPSGRGQGRRIPDPASASSCPRRGARRRSPRGGDPVGVPTERILTPADVRGRHRTLPPPVRAGRWPTLDEAGTRSCSFSTTRGEARHLPGAGARARRPPDLRRRPETDRTPPCSWSTTRSRRRPHRDLVEEGFLVRTRADADTREARTGDTTRRDAALASGAHFVSTDYVWPDERLGTGYVVDLPGDGAARCNPISATPRCARADLSG